MIQKPNLYFIETSRLWGRTTIEHVQQTQGTTRQNEEVQEDLTKDSNNIHADSKCNRLKDEDILNSVQMGLVSNNRKYI